MGNVQQAKMQPGASAVRRNAPAGDFIDHFMLPGDTWMGGRTHCERINPLDNGESFGWCPGANRGFQPQPLQTFNISDQPIGAQLSAPEPVATVTATEPTLEPEPVTEPPPPPEDDIMSDDAVEAIAEALVHGKAEIAAAKVG